MKGRIGVDDRECRAIKQQALENGIIIVTGDSGYKFAECYEDAEEMIGRMEKQAKVMLMQTNKIRRTLGRDEQLKMVI
jgi:hypothetical protein